MKIKNLFTDKHSPMLSKGAKLLLLTTLVVAMVGCSGKHTRNYYGSASPSAKTPPTKIQNNICKIYQYDRNWKWAAKKSARKWGTPEHILIAFVYQESRFKQHASPKYRGSKTSSAYGYSQAQPGTWKEYQKATKNNRARRTNVYDALDFIGWYNHNSNRRNHISKNNSHDLYLAYHEGNGGYKRKSFKKKPWLLKVSKKVSKLALAYQRQTRSCR